jgi:phosphoribosyl 1,2-cyclic phosphate phosphodiesterase
MGVPTLGCTCAVCADAYLPGSPNRRTRPSILLQYPATDGPLEAGTSHLEPRSVLIDTGQDFHAQAVRERIMSVDAVLYTHGHADHILGMDDLRPLSFRVAEGSRNPAGLPLYADDATATVIERVFEYTFRTVDRYATAARVTMNRLSTDPGTSVSLFGATFLRVPVTHGRTTIAGYRFGSAAYLTDTSDIPDSSLPLLENLDILILDALRKEPHPSHLHLEKSVELVKKIAPKRAYFTHISHDLDHNATNAELPGNMRLAHDGLKLDFDIA